MCMSFHNLIVNVDDILHYGNTCLTKETQIALKSCGERLLTLEIDSNEMFQIGISSKCSSCEQGLKSRNK